MAKEYIKHLVECKCSLPQFRERDVPVPHSFVVFSVVNEDGSIQPSYAECNNCGCIHKVLEVGISKRLPKETMASLPKIKEIALGLPEQIRTILESYKCDLPTWQEAAFILANQMWGRPVILSKETDDDLVVGKYLLIISKDIIKIETYTSGGEDDE